MVLPHRVFALSFIFCLALISRVAPPVLAQTPATPPAGSAEGRANGGGEDAFNNACRTCHSMKQGDHRLGPSLSAIVGRKAGSAEGYNSSPSLQNSGLTWNAQNIDAFIANPDAIVPGNNMKPYTGISDAALRAKIIGYLGSP